MSLLVTDCPRCGARRMSFDVANALFVGIDYGWRHHLELFCVCRQCERSTIFIVAQLHVEHERLFEKAENIVKIGEALTSYVRVERHVSLRDELKQAPPDYLPDNIRDAFNEGATCLATACWNAAGVMFRMCVDLATQPLLPQGEAEGLNAKTRRDLGLRLPWLFRNGLLPEGLAELASCIKEDGNDGAHAGTLREEDAEDLLDFTRALLERRYTEPERLRLAKERRDQRRKKDG